MKRMIMNLRNTIAALLLLLLSAGYTFAQNAAGDDASIPTAKHDFGQYIGPLILLVLVSYVGYRFWHDNYSHAGKQGDDAKHTPHHQ